MSKKECFDKISMLLPSEEISFYTDKTGGAKDLLKPGIFVTIHYTAHSADKKAIIRLYNENAQKDEMRQTITLPFLTDKDVKLCRDIISGKDYIAMIRGSYSDRIVVGIIYGFYAVQNDDLLQAGVSEHSGLTPKSVRGSYTMTYDGQDCFLIAKLTERDPDGEQFFWLVDGDYGYKITMDHRTKFMRKNEDGADDENVFAVTQRTPLPEVLQQKGLRYELRIGCLKITTIKNVKATGTGQSSYFADVYDNFFDTWRKYGQIEYDTMLEKQKDTGFLNYINPRQISSNIITAEIENPGAISIFKEKMRNNGFTGEDNIERISVTPEDIRLKYPVTGVLKEITDDSRAIIELKYYPRQGLGKKGKIEADISGSQASFERREKAFDRIELNKAGMPDLSKLIRGYRSLPGEQQHPNYKPGKNVLNIFGNNPNPSQIEAVKVALNTPDIAVIQGPPGTGKSTVISAIVQALYDVEGSDEINYAQNLLTAYQRDATDNLAGKLNVYDLPVPVFKGMREDENDDIFGEAAGNWIRKKRNLILDDSIETNIKPNTIKKFRFLKKIDRWKLSYNPDTAGFDQNLVILKSLDEGPEQRFLTSEQRLLIKKFLFELNGEDDPAAKSLIRNLPVTKKAWEDNGAEFSQSLLRQLFGRNIPVSVKKRAEKIREMYQEQDINFLKIKQTVYLMLSDLNRQPYRTSRADFNRKIADLLKSIQETLEEQKTSDADMILFDYYDALLHDDKKTAESLAECCSIIAATHQKTVSEPVVRMKASGSKNYDDELYVTFDNVLIDEAARSSPPDMLIPMGCALKRIILVGDQKQLPQFIDNDVAIKTAGGNENTAEMELLNQSLFASLIEKTGMLTSGDNIKRFVRLDTQYRMPEKLGDFISGQFYEGKLKYGGGNHEQILPGIAGKQMVWASVPVSYGAESKKKKSFCREPEAAVIMKLLQKYTSDEAGKDYSYGIITFYTGQKELLQIKLDETGLSGKFDITCGTVDAMQGKEFDIVFLSMVRSNSELIDSRRNVYGFITNKNRQCVALSRAKKCVIVVGDPAMMDRQEAAEKIEAFCDFYHICEENSGKKGSYAGII